MGWESKPSSVLDGHLSRSPGDRPRRRLRGGSRLPASASNLLAADSEIAAGRIALFTRRLPAGLVSVALARYTARQSGLSTHGSPRASPAFTGHPCSVQLGLSSDASAPATILAHPHPLLSTCSGSRQWQTVRAPGPQVMPAARTPSSVRHPRWPRCRRGDLNSHGVTPTTP
jgi:hypothetical protein